VTAGTCKNVLLVGASGDVRKNILADLLGDPHFKISVLSRIDSSANFASNANIIKVNYSDKSALIKALTGQDIVISIVVGEALMKNRGKTLIEASVKWFIPSEFGFELDNPSASSIPINIPLLENIKLLRQNPSRIGYTFISTGAFLDCGVDNGFLGFVIPNPTATLYVSGTLIKNLGKAVVTILHHPELSLNQRICLADATRACNEQNFILFSGRKLLLHMRMVCVADLIIKSFSVNQHRSSWLS